MDEAEEFEIRSMSEAELKRRVLEIARREGWYVYSTPQAKPSRPQRGADAGYPDTTLARDGRVVWMEFKQERGIVEKGQIAWMHHLGPSMLVIRPSDLLAGRVHEVLR